MKRDVLKPMYERTLMGQTVNMPPMPGVQGAGGTGLVLCALVCCVLRVGEVNKNVTALRIRM